jgi:hypothetical protein
MSFEANFTALQEAAELLSSQVERQPDEMKARLANLFRTASGTVNDFDRLAQTRFYGDVIALAHTVLDQNRTSGRLWRIDVQYLLRTDPGDMDPPHSEQLHVDAEDKTEAALLGRRKLTQRLIKYGLITSAADYTVLRETTPRLVAEGGRLL